MITLKDLAVYVAILSVIFMLGVSYTNTDTLRERNYAQEIELATSSVSVLVDSYRLATGISLTDENWKSEMESISPLPRMSFDSEWHYKKTASDTYICLSSKSKRAVGGAFNYLADKYPDSYSVIDNCGIDDDVSILSYKIK